MPRPLYGAAQAALRRLGGRWLYDRARRAAMLAQWLTSRPDEPEFNVLRALGPQGLSVVVDVGANAGQSAVTFGFLFPEARIHAFEPNPSLLGELAVVRRRGGPRLSVEAGALGAEAGELTLSVPIVGRMPVPARASLIAREAEAGGAQIARGQTLRLTRLEVPVRPLDAYDLAPDLLKIDVEGAEPEVLAGAARTLAAHRPIVVLERNARIGDCAAALSRAGDYALFQAADRGARLVPAAAAGSANLFALTPAQAAALAASGPGLPASALAAGRPWA